jgi:integrase
LILNHRGRLTLQHRSSRRAIERKAHASVWLIDAAIGTRLYIPIFLAITTGMRRGEILALRWKDVELARGFLTATRSLEQTKAGGLRFKTPKSRKGRHPSLPPLMVDALHAHKRDQESRRALLGSAYEENDLVCCVEDGRIWNPAAFTSTYRALLSRRKIKNIRFHDLRHSHASQLSRSRVNPKVISERLGHSKVGFTLDVYAHLLPDMQEEAATQTNSGLAAAFSQQISLANR